MSDSEYVSHRLPLGGERYILWNWSLVVEIYDWKVVDDLGWRLPLAAVCLPDQADELFELHGKLLLHDPETLIAFNAAVDRGASVPWCEDGVISWRGRKDV